MPTQAVIPRDELGLAGNWQKFQYFIWYAEPERSEDWGLVYTHRRDSGLIAQSNASVITQEMQRFAGGPHPSVVFEHHTHALAGWVAGFSLMVFTRRGEQTAAYRHYLTICARLDDYVLLDETDHSARVLEATLGNIREAAWSLTDYDLPEGWAQQVYDWLENSKHSEQLADVDDQGGYPGEGPLREAVEALFSGSFQKNTVTKGAYVQHRTGTANP